MFSKISLTLFFIAGALAGELTISTPAALIQCQPVQVKWEGGMAPYFLAAIPGGQPSAPALKDFGSQSGNMLTWNVDLPAGTSVTMRLTDSAGNINYAQAVTIQPGSGSCGGAVAAVAESSMNSAMMSGMSSASMMPSASMSMSMMSAPSAMSSPSGMMSSMISGSMSGSMSMASASASASMASGMSKSMSMSMSSMSSRSSASSAVARPSSASASASPNSASAIENVTKSGLVGALVAVFAFAWA